MKGKSKVIAGLNEALCAELTAINQYVIHSRMCANWGYIKLAEKAMKEAVEEMKHADVAIERILFLEGTPDISSYDTIRVGADVKAQVGGNATALHFSSEQGHLEVIRILLANGMDVNVKARDTIPLHLAALNGRLDVVELLLDSDADMNAKNQQGGTPLHLAAQEGHQDVVATLLDHGADVNARGGENLATPLHSAT